jgi:catechol 2,3-dioxygenase-like lactoylglutathione lyase family enzyme
MSDNAAPAFSQLNLVVRDMGATLAFYRRLGVPVEAEPGGAHAAATLASGFVLEWDTAEFAALWDSGSPGSLPGSTVIGFAVPTRQAVDDVYADLTGAGHRGRQRPYDAFWGSRYAIVEDPDGNPIGLMSPMEEEHRHPPRQAPAGA